MHRTALLYTTNENNICRPPRLLHHPFFFLTKTENTMRMLFIFARRKKKHLHLPPSQYVVILTLPSAAILITYLHALLLNPPADGYMFFFQTIKNHFAAQVLLFASPKNKICLPLNSVAVRCKRQKASLRRPSQWANGLVANLEQHYSTVGAMGSNLRNDCFSQSTPT